jgi:hypothetical protein
MIATLSPWASLGAFDMLQRPPMGDKPRPRRSQYTFFLSLDSSRCGAGPLGALCMARVGVTAAKLP